MNIIDRVQKLNITPTVKVALIQASVALLIFGLGIRYGRSQLSTSTADESGKAAKPFFQTLSPEEMGQFDGFMDQYRSKELSTNIQESYRMLEFIDMKLISLEGHTFSGKYKLGKASIRDLLVKAYSDLKEAYQARIDAIGKALSDNSASALPAIAKANAKAESSSLHYLMALVTYEKLGERERIPTHQLHPLISKYRNITGFQGAVNVEG